jgi:hypothetical protein
MQRQALQALAAALVLGSAGAFAQGGDLAGVTMRVLDDVSDVDAVVLELDANRGEGEDAAAGDEGAEGGDDATAADERGREAASRDADEDARRAERRERDDLHDVDADERGEGRLEDRDVERSTVPPPIAP